MRSTAAGQDLDPARLPHSQVASWVVHSVRARIIGAHFGLTPKRYQSGGTVDRPGRISKRSDNEVRAVLNEDAKSMLTRYRGGAALRPGVCRSRTAAATKRLLPRSRGSSP